MPTARIQTALRLETSLYAKIAKLAKREGVSVNEWLVRAAAERVAQTEKPNA